MAGMPYDSDRLATVFGGSGFVGRYIVRALAREGWRVRAANRRPDLAGFLRPAGGVGQIAAVQANLRYPDSIARVVEGADVVINAAGVKSESGRQNYEAVHVFGAREIARAAREAGARALIQISGIGAVSDSPNPYISSKGRAEDAARAEYPEAIMLRPSVVFGPEDEFFNRFALLARFLPILPLFGGGTTKLQPVYVGDVALAATLAAAGLARAGQIYELGGPAVMTLREIVAFTLKVVERRRALIGLPFGVSRAMAGMTETASALTLGLFPQALVTTRDQIDLLRDDNIVSDAATRDGRTLRGLGLEARSVEAMAPAYLTRYRKTGQYASSRQA
jgi:NADH dehydrogenase